MMGKAPKFTIYSIAAECNQALVIHTSEHVPKDTEGSRGGPLPHSYMYHAIQWRVKQ